MLQTRNHECYKHGVMEIANMRVHCSITLPTCLQTQKVSIYLAAMGFKFTDCDKHPQPFSRIFFGKSVDRHASLDVSSKALT